MCGREHFLSRDDVLVVRSSPSILLLTLTVSQTKIHLLAGHAPPSSRRRRAKTWWAKAQRLVRAHCIPGVP
eukprot:2642871-Lingulodinium_polyedra.AAC.1